MKLLLAALLFLNPTVTAFAGVWDVATPLNTDPISQGDDRIREAKAALQEALRGGLADGLEAVFPGGSPSSAPVFHYRGQKGSTGARPAATYGGLYYNTTTGTIQRSSYTASDTGAGWEDITENAAFEAIHQKVGASLASVTGVITLPETGNSFNVSGTEAITSFTGWSAGVVIVKWVSARTITHNGSSLILPGAVNRAAQAGDIGTYEFVGANQVREIAWNPAYIAPTRQVLTSGTAATYTTPTGCKQLKVRMVGGGGGGAESGSGTNPGTVGSPSIFNSIEAGGGAPGAVSSADGTAPVAGAGSASFRCFGAAGGIGGTNSMGGGGGNSAFGGGARPRSSGVGFSGDANTGGGGGSNRDGGGVCGQGGGGGEYVEIIINNPAATYTYTVGAGGAGGTGNATDDGGAGGSGIVIVDEYY